MRFFFTLLSFFTLITPAIATEIIFPHYDTKTFTISDWKYVSRVLLKKNNTEELSLQSKQQDQSIQLYFVCSEKTSEAFIHFDDRFLISSNKLRCSQMADVFRSADPECPITLVLNYETKTVDRVEATCKPVQKK